MALSYSILYTRVTMYHVLRHSKGPTLSCQLGVTCETRACPRGAALDARRSWSASACCDSGLRPCVFFPFIAALALRKRGGFGAAWHRCFSLFKVEQENFCTTSTERNSVASEIFRDFNVTSATSTVILLFMCPPRIYLLTPSLRPHGLSAGSREGATHHPSFYKTNRVPLTLQSWSESYAFLIVQYV